MIAEPAARIKCSKSRATCESGTPPLVSLRSTQATLQRSHVVIFMGINDIALPGTTFEPGGIVRTPDEIIAGYKQLIERAHLHSIKVIGSPLAPFENAYKGEPLQDYFTPDKEAKRLAVNKWIRMSGAFDGIIDFERALADPAHPAALAAAYDSGDHLHPNDAGYRAMAESIDLKLFK